MSCRNLCAREWLLTHARGTTAEFKSYFDQLSAPEKKVPFCHITSFVYLTASTCKKYDEMAAKLVSRLLNIANNPTNICSDRKEVWLQGRVGSRVNEDYHCIIIFSAVM